MPACAIVTCKHRSESTTLLNDGITFHRFPSNPEIKLKWITATGRGPVWWPVKRSTICSVHFKEDLFKPLPKSRRLFDWAVPTLKLPHILTNVEIKQEFEEENLVVSYLEIGPEIIGTTPIQPTDEDPISIHRIQPSTSTAASDVDPLVKTEILEEPEIRDSDSDIESALDTPKEAKLRSILKKKDKVIEQQRKENRNLYESNKRLVSEIGRLQELVNKLELRRCTVCNSELTS